MRKLILTAVLVMVCVNACGRAEKDAYFRPIPPVVRETSQGMKVFVIEDHELPTAEVFFYLPGGSLYDPPALEGLSSIAMQSIRLSGTKDRAPEAVDAELDALGASLEFGSGVEFNTASLALQKKDLDRGLSLLFGLLRHSDINDRHFQNVKNRVKAALLREKEDPMTLASREYPAMIYGDGSAWGRKATAESVDRIRLEDVAAYRSYIDPKKIVVAASGDFSVDELMAALEEKTKDWKVEAKAWSPVASVTASFEKKSSVIAQKGLTQSTIFVGHLGDNRNNPDKYSLMVMNFILGGSGALTSRMGEEIRSSAGKAYSVWSDFGFGKDLGVFKAVAQTASPNTVWVAEKMQQMIKDVHDDPKFAPAEIDRTKKAILRSLIFGFETRFAQVKEAARFYLFGYPDDYLLRFQKGIDKVTEEDLKRVAKKYLHPEGLKVLIITNEEEAKKIQ